MNIYYFPVKNITGYKILINNGGKHKMSDKHRTSGTNPSQENGADTSTHDCSRTQKGNSVKTDSGR